MDEQCRNCGLSLKVQGNTALCTCVLAPDNTAESTSVFVVDESAPVEDLLTSKLRRIRELEALVRGVQRLNIKPCLCCAPGCECGNYSDPCVFCEIRAVELP
jgi:hypothetical protein